MIKIDACLPGRRHVYARGGWGGDGEGCSDSHGAVCTACSDSHEGRVHCRPQGVTRRAGRGNDQRGPCAPQTAGGLPAGRGLAGPASAGPTGSSSHGAVRTQQRQPRGPCALQTARGHPQGGGRTEGSRMGRRPSRPQGGGSQGGREPTGGVAALKAA